MIYDEYVAAVKDLRYLASNVAFTKRKDYTQGSGDVLANFKRIAEKLKVSPRLVWGVYMAKQVDALLTWAGSGEVASESVESRFIDLYNYTLLGYAIHKETEDR